MSTTEILAFTFNSDGDIDSIHEPCKEIKRDLEQKGAEYRGPWTPKPVTFIEMKYQLGRVDFPTVKKHKKTASDPEESWFTSIELREEEREQLQRIMQDVEEDDKKHPGVEVAIARGFEIADDGRIQDYLTYFPGDIFLRAAVDKPVIPENNHAPYTYDPNNDHVTELEPERNNK